MIKGQRHLWAVLWVAIVLAFPACARADSVRLLLQNGYLPQLPVLVRVEVLRADGSKNRDLWDAEATLSVDQPGINLSTNRIALRNGLGSGLVTFAGGGDFNLTVGVASMQASRAMRTLANVPVTAVGGSLPGSSSTWNGVVWMTNDVTIPTGHTLTIESNTVVLINGVTSGTTAPDLIVNGTLRSLGTEEHPVVITCADVGRRWGQIRHDNAQPSIYRYTAITLGGRTTGEGHTSTGPVIRPSNSRITFEGCTISDHADASGGPGKIMLASGSDLTFIDCQLARSRMGPEISGTALLCTNTWITDLKGPDDADGIYIHTQSAGQSAELIDCVIAGGDDDGIDTLGSNITVKDCVIRDWRKPDEDAKGISVFNGEAHVRHCLIVNCLVGLSAKWNTGAPTLVTIDQSTITGITNAVAAAFKSTAPGPFIDIRITNSILWAIEGAHSDFGPTNFTIGYCDSANPWPGTGNISADPLFTNVGGFDYRLQAGSPCIDAGDPTSPLDLDGTRLDLGYYPTLQNNSPPMVDQPPQSQTVEEYCDATFTVSASSATPLSFQWRRDTFDIPGATSNTFIETNATTLQSGTKYDVKVSNAGGSVFSEAGILTVSRVTSAPVISAQPRDLRVVPGVSATLSVSAISAITCLHTNLEYGWSFKNNVVAGATNSSLTITNVQQKDVGTYLVRVSDYNGNEAVSQPASLILVTGTTLSGAAILPGGDFQITFDASSNLNYIVRASTNLLNWEPVSVLISGSGQLDWVDTNASNFDKRFYQVETTP